MIVWSDSASNNVLIPPNTQQSMDTLRERIDRDDMYMFVGKEYSRIFNNIFVLRNWI